MARQNIDEKWKTDPRRTALANRIGGRSADGMRVEVNWLVMSHKGQMIPLKEFKYVESWQEWIDCGLGDVRGDMVHIAGSDEYSEFFEKQRANSAKGGAVMKAKAADRSPNKPKDSPKSPSFSFSFSSSEEEKEKTPIVPLKGDDSFWWRSEFDRLAKRYRDEFPGTSGGTKALDRFRDQFRTEDSVAALDLALTHYRQVLDYQDWRHPKTTFETFLGSKRSGYFWRSFLDPPNLPDKAQAQLRTTEIDAEIDRIFQKAGSE